MISVTTNETDSIVVWTCILACAMLVLIVIVEMYNRLVRLRQHCRESWSGIETELKRRYDLIPNLVDVVKAYAAHERETLQAVIAARQAAIASVGSPKKQSQDENELIHTMKKMLAVIEAYPQLRASENFLKLQDALTDTEDRIQAARRFYNANVRDLNSRVGMFPSNIIAGIFGFKEAEFFELENLEVQKFPVKVSV